MKDDVQDFLPNAYMKCNQWGFSGKALIIFSSSGEEQKILDVHCIYLIDAIANKGCYLIEIFCGNKSVKISFATHTEYADFLVGIRNKMATKV